ncbi:YjfB family protein [Paenibacillus polymyxa]|uniref:YjfB family protein n=1 Tax=Paenibacillus polymyxa TaxID=1406 RepID=UPI0004B5FEFE
MDIAALSTGMSQASLAQAVSVKVLGMAKDQGSEQGQALVQMMEKKRTTTSWGSTGHPGISTSYS